MMEKIKSDSASGRKPYFCRPVPRPRPSHPPETNRLLLSDAGFELLLEEISTIVEPEPDGEATFQWVLARR